LFDSRSFNPRSQLSVEGPVFYRADEGCCPDPRILQPTVRPSSLTYGGPVRDVTGFFCRHPLVGPRAALPLARISFCRQVQSRNHLWPRPGVWRATTLHASISRLDLKFRSLQVRM